MFKFSMTCLLLITLYSCSNESKEQHQDTPISETNFEAISNQVFKFIKSRYPHEFKTHSQHYKPEDHVHFEADPDIDDHLIGNLSCYPILATGELYEIDLNNDNKFEYVCLLGLTPGLSWTQHILVLDKAGKILDSIDIKTREGVCHMTFEHLQNTDAFNLLVEWQQNLSTDDNSGLFIYSFDGNHLERILNQKLHWRMSDKRYNGPTNPSNIKEKTITAKLVDQNRNGIKELELSSKFLFFNGRDSLSTHILSWKENEFKQE